MKPFKFCLKNSFVFTALISGCATTSPPPVSISKSNLGSDKIFGQYCANNKQIRRLAVSIEYITPKLPKMSVDKAAGESAYYAKRKQDLLKKTLFSLADGEEHPNGRGADYLKVRQSDLNHHDLVEQISQYVIEENSYNSTSVKELLMRPTDTDKFILFLAIETDQRLRDRDHYEPTYISELKLLVDNFTLLEPLEFQNEAYKCDQDCLKNPDMDHDKIDLIAVDDEGKQSISDAVKEKDAIWIRYIKHFAKIKEAKSSNPRV
ncbi:MAG TPA: hypothetical protein VIG33_15965, partial [Pseudobdellovibrionaceae bacterium]